MDYAIKTESGQGGMTFDKADIIFNNIYLSWTIKKGSFFACLTFGHRFDELKKSTPNAEARAEEFGKEALQWMLAAGKAKDIEVFAEINKSEDPHRIKLLAEVRQADGLLVTFEHFVEVF
jgi:phage gp46-like protein